MSRGWRKWLFRLVRLSPYCLTIGTAYYFLSQSPFTDPMVERGTIEARRAVERALTRQVTPTWVRSEMELALEASDFDRVTTLAYLAADQGFPLDPDQARRMEVLDAQVNSTWAKTRDCAICIADISDCPSLTLMATCALPVELTPVGDMNALRRAGLDAVRGDDVDQIEVSLALVGLGATAAILVSGGTSVTVKAGATVLRIGRKIGTVNPRLLRSLHKMSDVELQPRQILPWVQGRVPLEKVLNTARLARISAVSSDLTRVARNTSPVETLQLLRFADGPDDVARLARLSDAAGPQTRASLMALGKTRAFRAMIRLSDLAIGAALALYVTALQIGIVLLQAVTGRMFRGIVKPKPKPKSGLWT